MVYDYVALINEMLNMQLSSEDTTHKLLCPFHNDHHPSMVLDQEGRFRCYSCKWFGNMYDFIIGIRGGNELDALDYLYRFRGQPGSIANTHTGMKHRVTQQVQLQQDIALAQDVVDGSPHKYIHTYTDLSRLQHIGTHQYYMLNRGYCLRTLQDYHIGVSDHLGKYPIFIPLTCMYPDGSEQVYGYQLRATSRDVHPKYLTMAGLHKGLHLYGKIHSYDDIIVVTEGRLDGMMIQQVIAPILGRPVSEVSLLGSSISEEQAALLRYYKPQMIICAFDQDMAGKGAYLQVLRKAAPCVVVDMALPHGDVASSQVPVLKTQFLQAVGLAQKRSPIYTISDSRANSDMSLAKPVQPVMPLMYTQM